MPVSVLPTPKRRNGDGRLPENEPVPLTFQGECKAPICFHRSDPDWHHCFVCGAIEGDHAHVESRARAPGKKRSPTNIVFLCRAHHRMVDETHECGHDVRRFADGKLHYIYWESGLTRKDLADRVIGEAGRSGEGQANTQPSVPVETSTLRNRRSPARLSAHPQVIGEVGGRSAPLFEEASLREGTLPGSPAHLSAHLQEAPESPQDEAETTSSGGPMVIVTLPPDDSEPVFHSPGRPEFPDVCLEEGRLILRDGLLFKRFEEIVQNLESMQRNLNWFIGDAVVYGEKTYGESCYQAFSGFERMGFALERIKQAGWVASKFPPGTRVLALPWAAHRIVAALPEPERAELLARAEAEGMSTRELREAIQQASEPAGGDPEGCAHEWKCSKCGAKR